MSESEAEKYGLGDRWRAAFKRRQEIIARKSVARVELAGAIAELLKYAEAEQISQRKMAREAGLSWGTYLRCRDGLADPVIWLPRIQAAVHQITTQTPR
jgi:adenylosuccinate lyase